MDLYALPPERFTAARDAAAKTDRSLKGLRRPTVSAWVVNTLVRREPVLLEDLLALGASLAQAQAHEQGGVLRQLTEQRRELVAAVTERAVALAGRDLSPAARAEVEATLEAALADRASAEAVRSGRLVRPLAYAGFGGVDLEGAVAQLPAGGSGASTRTAARPAGAGREGTRRAARVRTLEATALRAQGSLDDAVVRAQGAARALAAAESDLAREGAEEQRRAQAVEQAEQVLQAARHAAGEAGHRRVEASQARAEAERRARRATDAVRVAQQEAEGARSALDAARQR